MFNPKESLLDQQLIVSGLEMSIDPFTAISAGVSIFGGIMGSRNASRQNRANRRARKKQKKAAKKQAKATNKYNKEVFEAEQQNYFNNKQFQYDQAVTDWKYNQSIQDFEYLQAARRYGAAAENTQDELVYNSIAAMDAYEAEAAALNEILAEDAFNRQGDLVDRLQQEGEAAMGQAGNSRNKAIQSRLAGIGRNTAIVDASLVSSVEQSQRNMRGIAMQKMAADKKAMASLMIRPEELPSIPMPQKGPDAIFVKPMKATPQYIPPPTRQSTAAPLIAGFGSAAKTLQGVDWHKTFGWKK